MKGLFIFLGGAILGSAITYRLMKNYYDPEDYDEDYDEDEVYDYGEPEPDNSEVTQDQIIEENGYTQYSSNIKTNEKREEEDEMDKPYIITPEEFSDSEYNTETLSYWADGVVTDIDDEPLTDDQIEDLIGEDSLSHFGEYEDDSVFVRNDRLRIDYEILADTRRYGDVYDG